MLNRDMKKHKVSFDKSYKGYEFLVELNFTWENGTPSFFVSVYEYINKVAGSKVLVVKDDFGDVMMLNQFHEKNWVDEKQIIELLSQYINIMIKTYVQTQENFEIVKDILDTVKENEENKVDE